MAPDTDTGGHTLEWILELEPVQPVVPVQIQAPAPTDLCFEIIEVEGPEVELIITI